MPSNDLQDDRALTDAVPGPDAAVPAAEEPLLAHLMHGLRYHFSRLRFSESQNIKDCSAAHVVVYIMIMLFQVEVMKCRLLKNEY